MNFQAHYALFHSLRLHYILWCLCNYSTLTEVEEEDNGHLGILHFVSPSPSCNDLIHIYRPIIIGYMSVQ